VHLREKLWSIIIFCPGRKKEEGRRRKAYVSVSFLSYRKALYIVAWWRKKTAIALNKEVNVRTL